MVKVKVGMSNTETNAPASIPIEALRFYREGHPKVNYRKASIKVEQKCGGVIRQPALATSKLCSLEKKWTYAS